MQVFVGGSATLTIEPGVTIYGYKDDGTGSAPCLVIENGAMINAAGTSSAPITFTSVLPSSFLPSSGNWGGLIIMGGATVYGTTQEVEGITGYSYGGTDDADNSGTLQYVRVWYGGAVIGADNEINGITFAGVGSGTTVEYCEVAFNVDDGFEYFGGTVNSKYLSVLFAGDDAIDTDLGFSGSIQFAYVMVGSGGNHGTEMDSKYDVAPRSYPQLYSATFIGHLNHAVTSASTDETSASIIHLREGTAGAFGNILVYNTGTYGVQNEKCSSDGSSNPQGTQVYTGSTSELFWSANNVIYGSGDAFEIDASCESGSWTSSGATAVTTDPGLENMPFDADIDTTTWDPRPATTSSILYTGTVDTVPDNGFFVQTDYIGAFPYTDYYDADGRRLATVGSNGFWLAGLSYASDNGITESSAGMEVDDTYYDGVCASGQCIELCGDLSLKTYLYKADGPFLLTCQVFVQDYLFIEAGTTIYSLSATQAVSLGNADAAPALIVEVGATIDAVGTATSPITFTTNQASPGQTRGLWGGLIVMGSASVYGTTQAVEGITGYTYGGTDDTDNSGTLKYVRVWHGGAAIGADNEINGITFAGVGSGTTVENIEVAFNLDDGVEFFGGTVNVKYVSVLFVGDDSIDTDLGYSGKIQYAFVLIGQDGHHGTEMVRTARLRARSGCL